MVLIPSLLRVRPGRCYHHRAGPILRMWPGRGIASDLASGSQVGEAERHRPGGGSLAMPVEVGKSVPPRNPGSATQSPHRRARIAAASSSASDRLSDWRGLQRAAISSEGIKDDAGARSSLENKKFPQRGAIVRNTLEPPRLRASGDAGKGGWYGRLTAGTDEIEPNIKAPPL